MKTAAWNGAERGDWGAEQSTKVEQFTISKRRGETISPVKVVPPISCMAWPAPLVTFPPSPPSSHQYIDLLTTFSMSLIRHPGDRDPSTSPGLARPLVCRFHIHRLNWNWLIIHLDYCSLLTRPLINIKLSPPPPLARKLEMDNLLFINQMRSRLEVLQLSATG